MRADLAALFSRSALKAAALCAAFSLLSLLLASLALAPDSLAPAPEQTVRGSALLTGLRDPDIGRNMPLFGVTAAAAENLGPGQTGVFLALHFCLYGLVFAAGALLGGRRAAWAALLLGGLGGCRAAISYNPEQAFYSLLLLLVFCFQLVRRRSPGAAYSALLGLAVGVSLLARSPLALFPPVLLASDWLERRPGLRAFAPQALLLLACSYALLLPWGFMNRAVSGRFAVLDTERAACNIISAARGCVFHIEGDPYRLAALRPGDSPAAYFISEVKKAPLRYAFSVLRRAWSALLFYPLLSLLAAWALARRSLPGALWCLPAYFALAHLPLSLGPRYFYPLLFLLPPLVAAAAVRAGRGSTAARLPVFALGGAAAAAALLALALAAAYPYRSADGETAAALSLRFPRDRSAALQACVELRAQEDRYLTCLARFAAGFGDAGAAFLAQVAASPAPYAVPAPAYGGEEKYRTALRAEILRLLRAAELGDRAGAAAHFARARRIYAAAASLAHWLPFEQEARRDLFLKSLSASYFDRYLYRGCLETGGWRARGWCGEPPVFPLQGRALLAAPAFSAYSGARRLLGALRGPPAQGDTQAGLALAADDESFWAEHAAPALALWPLRRAAALREILVKELKLPGSAALPPVRVPRAAGGRAAGPAGAPRAAAKPGAAPAPAVCRAGAADKEAALRACRAIVYLTAAGAARRPAGAAADAALISHGLLKELGRGEEALEALVWAVETAPPGWAGRAEAMRRLAGEADK